MKALKNKIVKGLTDYASYPVVPTDTAAPKPGYPYLSYKITSPLDNNGGFNLIDRVVPSASAGFEYDIEVTREEQAQLTISINAYSGDDDEACGLAIKAADWFKFIGYEYLKDCNIVVINVSGVGNRTAQIVDDYERRYGFDVRLRAARAMLKIIGAVERFDFHSEVIK